MSSKGSCNQGHWFFQEEFKWRNIASVIWIWTVTFPILALFLFGFMGDMSRHVYIIYDYLAALLALHTLGIFFITASLTACFVFVHSYCYSASQKYPRNRFEFLSDTLTFSNMLCLIISGASFMLISHLVSCILAGPYSWSYLECYSQDLNHASIKPKCKEGFWILFIYFGLIVGILNGLDWILNLRYCMKIWNVQEAKFMYLKCKSPCLLSNCASRSAGILYYFLITAYILGFVASDLAALFSGSYACEFYSFQFWRMFKIIPVAWNLWLVGTLSLLLWEISWQFFNAYQTQKYAFYLHPVFLENREKLLVENLAETETNSYLVQHLAFRHLATITKLSPSKRQVIFSLSHESDNGQPVTWTKVLNYCLHHIRQLTSDITEYQLALSDTANDRPIVKNVFSDSMQDTNALEVNSLEELNASHQHYESPLRFRNAQDISSYSIQNQSIGVPTPRLWTKPSMDSGMRNQPVYQSAAQRQNLQIREKLQLYAKKLTTFRIGLYFLKMVPSWTLRNLYRKHILVKWSLQSLSFLCAASVSEDKFGVVQAKLREVIECLIDLLKALDSIGKIGQSPSQIDKLHFSIHSEVKLSLHRIIDAFGVSLKTINLSHEYAGNLEMFYRYDD